MTRKYQQLITCYEQPLTLCCTKLRTILTRLNVNGVSVMSIMVATSLQLTPAHSSSALWLQCQEVSQFTQLRVIFLSNSTKNETETALLWFARHEWSQVEQHSMMCCWLQGASNCFTYSVLNTWVLCWAALILLRIILRPLDH